MYFLYRTKNTSNHIISYGMVWAQTGIIALAHSTAVMRIVSVWCPSVCLSRRVPTILHKDSSTRSDTSVQHAASVCLARAVVTSGVSMPPTMLTPRLAQPVYTSIVVADSSSAGVDIIRHIRCFPAQYVTTQHGGRRHQTSPRC